MCETSDELPIINVGEKTDKGKYEFLRMYYTLWNFITKGRDRIIIDTHAGSGAVDYEENKGIHDQRIIKRIYGSPLLAIVKTVAISKKLTIILNEKNQDRFLELKKYIDDFLENGVPYYEQIIDKSYYMSLETNKRRRMRDPKTKQPTNPKKSFPDSFDLKERTGFKIKRMKTKAKLILYDKNIEIIIDKILRDLKDFEDKEKIKPIALFLVDPCGAVSWNKVIKKICDRSQKDEGTELILNWSWEAINRNLTKADINLTLNKIYGIPLTKIDKEFEKIKTMEQFLEKYIRQLKKHFKYVIEYGVDKTLAVKPKRSGYKTYFLLYCTNNKSGRSLAGNKTKKIKTQMARGDFADISSFWKLR